MSTKKPIWNLISKLIVISMLLAACGTPAAPTTSAQPTPMPAAQATWEAGKDSTRLTESAPKPSLFEEVGKVEIKAPKGGSNFYAYVITAKADTKFTIEGKLVGNTYGASGYATKGSSYWVSFDVPETVSFGRHESFATLKDDTGGEQKIQIIVDVVKGCDFTVPAEDGLPETFINLTDGQTQDIMAGTTRIHALCVKDKPVYSVAIPDNACLADTITYQDDGSWGCYMYVDANTTMWMSLMGQWNAPYGIPEGWTIPPAQLLFPPTEIPTPIPGVQQG
jgi:hypothetical protein